MVTAFVRAWYRKFKSVKTALLVSYVFRFGRKINPSGNKWITDFAENRDFWMVIYKHIIIYEYLLYENILPWKTENRENVTAADGFVTRFMSCGNNNNFQRIDQKNWYPGNLSYLYRNNSIPTYYIMVCVYGLNTRRIIKLGRPYTYTAVYFLRRPMQVKCRRVKFFIY